MRPSTLSLALASSAVASVVPSDDCFARFHEDLADYAQCGSRDAIASCLSQLVRASPDVKSSLESCYATNGCSAPGAADEAAFALSRCDEMKVFEDLRRRHGAMLAAEAAGMPSITAAASLARRTSETAKGDDCFDIGSKDVKVCTHNTADNTKDCHMAQQTTKTCRDKWICTEDPNGADICMAKVDTLDVGGIILAIVFAVMVVGGIGFLTFMSCRESRAQKKLTARAEATALARAATKKKRAEEVRAPLMAQSQSQPQYQQEGANPFGDGQPH